MVYVCIIPHQIPGARRSIPPADWDGFRTALETELPIETRVELAEPTRTRPLAWVFWARPRADAGMPEFVQHALYHDVSNRIDAFLATHATDEPAGSR